MFVKIAKDCCTGKLPWILAACGMMLPLMMVTIPPSIDLAQHLHQIYLLKDMLLGDEYLHADKVINYYAPGNMIFWLGFICSFFVSSGWALAKCLIAIPLLLHFFFGYKCFSARKDGLFTVLVTSVFLFSQNMYWGFVNFLLGWPFFMAYCATLKEGTYRRLKIPLLFIYLVLLYEAHSLWFAAAMLFTVILLFTLNFSQDNAKRLFAVLLPFGILGALWFLGIREYRESSFDLKPQWLVEVWQRFSPRLLAIAMLGNIWYWLAAIFIELLLLYFFISIKRGYEIDKIFFAAGCMFLFFYVLFPDKFMNSIKFSSRWLPFSCICFALSLNPVVWGRANRFLAVVLVGVFVLTTGSLWRSFERDELSGLKEAVSSIKTRGRVLGIAYLQESKYFSGKPFIQMFAYTSVSGTRELNFSFVEHGSSIVSYKDKFSQHPWTSGIEWFPHSVKPSDFHYFDYVLVAGSPGEHKAFALVPEFQLCSSELVWRLYCRVEQLQPAAGKLKAISLRDSI